MAGKSSNTVSWMQICKDARNKKFAQIYLLYGAEPYYIDLIADTVLENALSEEERTFNLTSLYGLDCSVEQIVSECRRYPMMAERNVVIVREAQMLDKFDALQQYFRRPADSTVLILCYKKENFSEKECAKIAKEAGSNICSYQSNVLRDYEVPKVITQHVTAAGLAISADAAQLLAEHVGTDLSRIVTEINKLSIALHGKGEINTDLVEKNVGISKSYNMLELFNAVMKRDARKALTIVDYFEKNPKAGNSVMVLGIVMGIFMKLLIVGTSGKISQGDLAKKLGVSPYATTNYIEASRSHYNNRQCVMAIHLLRSYDRKLKGITSRQSEYPLLKEMMMKLFCI